MGAKVPVRLKTRRPTCKCDVCGCEFLSIQALRSHQAVVHPRTAKRVAYKPKIEVIARRPLLPVKKAMKPGIMKAKVVNVVDKAVPSTHTLEDYKPYNTRRFEFECPVCSKIFNVFFSAYRHIQKHHCINEQGEAVTPNSSDLIQPTRIELCTKCNKRVASNLLHTCETSPVEQRTSYTCYGCEQAFPSLHMFELHVPGVHCDEADTFSFPDVNTFTAWKEDMEAQMDMKYLILSKNDSSQIYHCNHMTSDETPTHYCPSCLIINETKGVQVAFFQEHFGHESKVYKVPERYKKFLVMVNPEYAIPNTKDTIELKGQFKKVMNDIITSSEKIDVNGLKILLRRAMDMMMVLKDYEKPMKTDVNKAISDDDIVKNLDKAKKRKVEVPDDSIAKRLRKESVQPRPEIKAEEVKIIKEVKTYSNPRKVTTPKLDESKKPETQSPSSFNDSYKNFVDASYNITVDKKPKPVEKKVEFNKKEIVKTKVGQFKPNTSPKENIKPILKEKPKEIKEVTFAKELNLPKIKPDFEYEVKEQENDCNILIIKI